METGDQHHVNDATEEVNWLACDAARPLLFTAIKWTSCAHIPHSTDSFASNKRARSLLEVNPTIQSACVGVQSEGVPLRKTYRATFYMYRNLSIHLPFAQLYMNHSARLSPVGRKWDLLPQATLRLVVWFRVPLSSSFWTGIFGREVLVMGRTCTSLSADSTSATWGEWVRGTKHIPIKFKGGNHKRDA